MESYRVQPTGTRKIELERGPGSVEPIGAGAVFGPRVEEIEPLSQIIQELNERFGTDFTAEDRVFIQHLQRQLSADEALVTAVRTNVPENARLTFDHVVGDRLQDMVDTNFKFYKRVTDDREFAKYFLDWLFERFRSTVR
jgi:type I restriction enzyme, R subunit